MKTYLMTAIGLLFLACAAFAGEWKVYRADDFGFGMLVPVETKLQGKDFGGGWGGLYAKLGVVEIFGIARKGVQSSPEEIEQFGVEVSGIPADKWVLEDEGKNVTGWKWYRTYSASSRTALVYAVLGTGKRGSYLIFLKTTPQDFKANKADYQKWYKSLTLY